MNYSRQYKIYKIMSNIRQVNNNMWLFHYLVPLLHLFCIIFFLLLNILPQIKVSFEVVAQILSTIEYNYLTMELANIYFAIGILISVLLVVLGIIRLKVISNYDQVAENKRLQRFLFIGTVMLAEAYEIGIFFFAWSFSQIYHHEGLVLAILKCCIPLAGYIYLSGRYSTNSLYGWFTVPITILITILDNPISYLFVIAVSFYLIMIVKSIMKKTFYGFVALVALFVMKNSQLFQQSGTAQMQISFICLGILALLTPIFIIHIKEKLDISNSQQRINDCFTILNQLKTDIPYSQMKFNQFYQLYNTVISFAISNKDDKSIEIDKILQKDPQVVTKKDLFLLLQKYLQNQCLNATQSNILKQIFLFKIKVQMQYPPFTIIQNFYNLNEEIQRGNNKVHQEKLFQIFDQITQKYAVFKNGDLQPAYLIHLNNLHEAFQNQVYVMLDRFSNFWRQISQQQIKLLALDACFEEVLQIESNIEQLYANIQKFGYFERQKKIIDITRSLYNVYEEVNKYSRDVKKIAQNFDKDTNHQFIILQNGSIKFISKDLMKTIGKKGTLSYENIDKQILFGKDFSYIIDDLTKNITPQNQMQWSHIPILNDEGQMQLKKVKILWYPSLEVKCRTMIKFTDDAELTHQAFLIYNIKTDTIEYFNSKFLSTFKIDKEKILYQIRNNQIFFNELFIQTDVPAQQVKKYLKEQNTIKCRIHLKNYVERGTLPSLPVEVNVLRCIQVNNQVTHCILRVSKVKQKVEAMVGPVTQTNLQRRQFYHQNNVVSSAGSALAKKYENQKFFCKIPNHYESKISQKQAQLEEKNRWVYRYYIHLLFQGMFLTVFVIWIMENVFLENRIQNYKNQMKAIDNTSEQYALLYQIYSIVTKLYYIQKYPQQSELVKNKTRTMLTNYYRTTQQAFLDQFLSRYLAQINDQPNENINYKINFDQFSINTTTNIPTLIDFAQNIKKHIIHSDVTFLLDNYNNFRNLTIEYEKSSVSEQKIINIAQAYEMYFWILISVVSVALVIILLILIKIQNTIRMVYSLIEQIPTSHLKDNLAAFEIRKKRILEVFFLSASDLLRKKAQYMKVTTLSSNLSDLSFGSNEFNEDLSYFLDNQLTKEESQKSKQITTNQSFKESNQQDQSLLQKTQEIKKVKKQKSQTNRMIKESFIVGIYRKSLFFILFFGFNAIFILNYLDLVKEKNGMLQVIEMKKTYYTSLLHIRRETVDTQMKPTMENFYNKSLPNYYNTDINLVASLPIQIILPELDGFGQKAHQALEEDNCKYAGKYLNSLSLTKPCQSYLGGMITKGFRQAFDIYLDNARIVSNLSIEQWGPYRCDLKACPPYFEHEWSGLLLGETARFIINMLDNSVHEAFQKMKTNARIQTIIKILGLFIVMVIYLIFDNSLKNRCWKAIKYFRIIPKKIMCSMKMTIFIRKNNILNELEIL